MRGTVSLWSLRSELPTSVQVSRDFTILIKEDLVQIWYISRCENGARCDPSDGGCSCPPGWRGPLCSERACSRSELYGPDCSLICRCDPNNTKMWVESWTNCYSVNILAFQFSQHLFTWLRTKQRIPLLIFTHKFCQVLEVISEEK